MTIRLILGGPSYRMEVDARHAAHLVTFALRASLPRVAAKKNFAGKLRHLVTPSPVSILGTMYEHGTPVAYARNHLFTGALEVDDATHLLWLDSDCSFVPSQIELYLHALLTLGDRPMFVVPTPQRDRVVNVWETAETRARVFLDGELRACHAGGFGCVVFNLAWYRAHWPKSPWFQDLWDPAIGYVSEDVGHCHALIARGFQPLYAGAYVDHHDRGDGKPIDVEQHKDVSNSIVGKHAIH